MMIKSVLLVIFTIVLTIPSVHAQPTDTLYTVSATIGGGYTRDISDFEVPTAGHEINRNQYNFFVRVMWHPEHLLSAGVEGGYSLFYSVRVHNQITAYRSAVPLYLVLSMKIIDGLQATAGFGIGIVSSTVLGEGDPINSSTISFGLTGAAQYLYDISRKLSLGTEARYTNLDLYDDYLISISLLVSYKLIEY